MDSGFLVYIKLWDSSGILILSSTILLSFPTMASDIYQEAQGMVDSFEKKFGVTKGKRRNHTKGFCFEGELVPTDQAIVNYSSSSIFNKPSTVIGRLSHKGGNNTAPDNKPAEYGMGLKITTHTNETHSMAMNTLDFFPVATPEAFAELMRAKAAGGNAVKAFKAKNKDLQRFKAHMATKNKTLTPYEGATYNSINSFYLVDASGNKQAVRWAFIPSEKQKIVMEPKANFFFENMQSNLNNHEISWNMVITFANDEDDINNPAIRWEGKHKQIVAATLKVTSISSEQDGKCDSVNYDPLILSKGFEPSEDRMLLARRASYAISFSKRISEKSK